MLKKTPLVKRSNQGLKKSIFVSKTAKALLIVILFAAVFLIGPLVLAQNGLSIPSFEGSGLATASLGVVVARIINAALGLLGLVAVIIIIYAGVLWMTAMGQEDKVAKAKRVLIEAVIGLIIIILSFAIAQFIFFALGINPWGGGGAPTGGGGGGGGGALGAGIISIVYPAPNARGVPRNTKIAITFKEPICNVKNNAGAIILDANNSGILGDCVDTNGNGNIDINVNDNNHDGHFNAGDTSECDLINPNIVKIRKKADSNGPYVEFVRVALTGDQKTFNFTPVDYLGNDQTPTWYTVALTSALKKANCSTSAFGSFGGYNWSFEVSTVLDLTPPKIESVVPKAILSPTTVARNTVIQINFNEAIDPTTLAGKSVIDGGGKTGLNLAPNSYDLMTVKAGENYVAGEFYFSNQYRTVEFITNDPCGTNSCGNEVYCLPGLSDILVLVKAATLAVPPKPTAIFPYTGLVDMADNSLDGNKDGITQGPAVAYDMNSAPTPAANNGDNATWIFKTNNLIDLIPPQIENRVPENSSADVDPDADLNLSFDKILLSSSLVQNLSLILDQTGLTDAQKSGYWFEKSETADKTTVIIKTSGLAENYNYGIIANSGIKDITQNCYLPCADLNKCVRKGKSTPGQYEVGSPWTPTQDAYPSCNLAP